MNAIILFMKPMMRFNVMVGIFLFVGIYYFVKKVLKSIQRLKAKDLLKNQKEFREIELLKKQIIKDIKQEIQKELKNELYESCIQEWRELWMDNIHEKMKDEMKQTVINHGLIITSLKDEIKSFIHIIKNVEDKLVDQKHHLIELKMANEKRKEFFSQNVHKVQELFIMNDLFSNQLMDISKRVTTLAKFPSMKTIGQYSFDVAAERVELQFAPISNYQPTPSVSFVCGTPNSKQFLVSMYNVKVLKLHYSLMQAPLLLQVLEIIKSNNLVLDLLHIVDCFDRDLSDVLVLFTNYKVLKFTHTIDFNDLVVHCSDNNITYVNVKE